MCKKNYQKQYRENITDEQKQKYRENMTDKKKNKNKRLSKTI